MNLSKDDRLASEGDRDAVHPRDKAANVLIDHFRKNDWPSGLNEIKVAERAEVVSFDSINSEVVLSIERHRAKGGAVYRQGMPMSAYQDYYMHFQVSLETGSVSYLGQFEGICHLSDLEALIDQLLSSDFFCLSVSEISPEEYEISEGVSNESKTIAGKKEAVQFALSFHDFFCREIKEKIIHLDIESTELSQAAAITPIYLRKRLVGLGEAAWNEREMLD